MSSFARCNSVIDTTLTNKPTRPDRDPARLISRRARAAAARGRIACCQVRKSMVRTKPTAVSE